MPADLDLILWGATGYTGRLVAEHLARRAPSGLRWAIGGRDAARLAELRETLAVDIETVVGDSLDASSMRRVASRARVVASTAGPFARLGTPLVEACVAAGTDYCDITGEVHWVRSLIDRLHVAARESGARIVPCCGFDSIPSDLGVWMLSQQLHRKHGARLVEARMLVRRMRGRVSGGTVTSLLELLEGAARDGALRRLLADPYSLAPRADHKPRVPSDQRGARFDAAFGRWTAPFIMAAINTRIVHRTNALLDYPYGREFRYSEALATSGRLQAQITALGLGLLIASGSWGPTRGLLRRFLPAAGSGPTPEERESGCFEILLLGRGAAAAETDPPIEVRGKVAADLDPGYGQTSRMLGESALCLALDPSGADGGILTPASCMAAPLLERLRATGMRFEA